MGRKMMKKKAAGDEQICRKRTGKGKCKSDSSDNKLRFCEKHYKEFEDFCRNKLTKKKDEKLKNTSGDAEGAGGSATGVETRGSNSRKKVMETGGIQPPTTSGGENVEEGKGWGCSDWRPFQHGSSSQAHLEMSKKFFVNLVSDSDDESVDSLGDPMDMLATENWNRHKHEMKWKSEVDMLSSLEEDPELCLKAVCAIYQQEISEDEISPKGLVVDSDTLRCASLAKFLMDNDCKGDLRKSVKELEKFDCKAVGDCKELVRRYSMYLFDIYDNRKDPFFLPATTASNGDQTA